MQEGSQEQEWNNIRPIDVIVQATKTLIKIEEKFGIKAEIYDFGFHLGADGTPKTMSLKIKGGNIISPTIPTWIKHWTPSMVAKTIFPPMQSLLEK